MQTSVLATLLFIASALPARTEPLKLRGSILTPEGSRWTDEVKGALNRIKAETGGRVGYTLYTAGVLGEESEVVEKLKRGDLDMAILSDLGLAYVLPDMHVLNLPYFARNEREFAYLEEKLHDRFTEGMRQHGFEFVFWSPVGVGYIFAVRPLRSFADIKGMRFLQWMDDPVGKATLEELPIAKSIPLRLADVKDALQQGRIDTVYNVPLALVAFQWHPYLKYAVDMPLVMAGGGTIISHAAWGRIAQRDRDVILRIMREETASFRAGVTTDSTASVRGLKKYGLVFVPPEPDTQTELEKIGERVRRRLAGTLFSKEILAEAERILTEYRKARNE